MQFFSGGKLPAVLHAHLFALFAYLAVHQLKRQIGSPEQSVHPGHQRLWPQVGVLEGLNRIADLDKAIADATQQRSRLIRHPGR